MLRSLTIDNIALLDHAEISFSEGLNVLSGETGAGKSVILDSLDFVLGAKADRGMIRFGQKECSVRAEFFSDDPQVMQHLSELDIEAEETIVITRRLNLDGKSSIKVNGCGVSGGMLKKLTADLVDVHGQSEHFFLLKEANQVRLLDKIAGVAPLQQNISNLLSARKEALADLEKLGGDEGERSRRIDILNYQIEELERAELTEGEEETLLALRAKYENAEKIRNGLNAARQYLIGEGAGCDCVNGAIRSFHAIARYGEYGALGERLESALADLNDVGETVEGLIDELDIDEREAERVDNRLDEIKTLKKKYGGSVSAAIGYLNSAKEELSLLLNCGVECEKLKRKLAKLSDEIYGLCLELTKERKIAAKTFTEQVTAELKTLNIASACFEIEFGDYTKDDVGHATAEGLDKIRFLFSANAGEPPKELGKIISGGEMSRFMLAVKARLSSIGSIGTYVFDEIDAGIGGKTARVVAEKFCTISRNTQIIAVSHLAQIAAFADRQFLIEKREEGDRTFSRIREVCGEERNRELARLIAGDDSEMSLRHAGELLKQAEQVKNSTL